jgi:hypothetical protein
VLVRWATEEWVSSRKEMMESLGHRSHHWAGGAGATPGRSTAALSSTYRTAHVEELSTTPHRASSVVSAGEALYRGDVRVSSSTAASTPQKQQSRFRGSSSTEPWAPASGGRDGSRVQGVPQQSPLLRGHADVVRKLHQLHQKGDRSVNGTLEGSGGRNGMALVEIGDSSSALSISSTGGKGSVGGGRVAVGANAALFPASALMGELEAATSSLSGGDTNGMSKNDLSAYHALLEVTASMTGESEGRTFPAAYFSPVALDHPEVTSEIVGDRRRILSRGARVYLERQFETVLVTTLDSNTSMRTDSGGADRCVTIANVYAILVAIDSHVAVCLVSCVYVTGRRADPSHLLALRPEKSECATLCCWRPRPVAFRRFVWVSETARWVVEPRPLSP